MLNPGPTSPISGRPRRVTYFILAASAVMVLQAFCLDLRVPDVKPDFFVREAVEIKLTPKWRYGYVQLWHGAVLVKARNLDHPTTCGRLAPTVLPMPGIAAIMRRDLDALPGKAALEACLYLALLAYVFFGWGWLKRGLLAQGRKRGRLLMAHVLGWLGLWLIAGAPLLLWGYGTPLFTNCMGPGALSSSGMYLGRVPPYSSTVSYHFLLAALAPLCLIPLIPISFALAWLAKITEGQVLWLRSLLSFLSTSSTVSYHYLLATLAPVCLILLAPICFALVWLPKITEGQVLWLGGLLFFLSLGLMRALLRG